MASLYLIPVTLGDTPHDHVLPAYNREVILHLRHFIVEEVRTARR
ncbi:MAG: SAM-dependent methyltransferase, partial [Bacteroidales bacterium]|nr:SAM-dependent methyltransferase [Bacteroidales bacterium]